MTQNNVNSLANLRKPKQKKEGYGYRYTVPQEKIDELFSYLAEGLSLKKAAKEAGMCFETARKYFRKGDSNRGIQPLQHRLTIFQTKISDKVNVLMEEQRMERIGFVRNLLEKAKNSILEEQRFFNQAGEEIEVYDKDGTKIEAHDFKKVSIRDIERLMKLEAFLCGGVKSREEESSMLSAEQISGM